MPGARLLVLTLLFSGATATSQRGPRPAGPPCAYAGYAPETRQLLRQIDQQLPRYVRRACTGERRYCRAWFELDSCFVPQPVASTFPVLSRRLEVRLRRGLTARYAKPILEMGSIQVLEYGSSASAQAAQAILDSLVQSCQSRSRRRPYDERCIGADVYKVARHDNCLLRFNMWVEDPLLRTSAYQLQADLMGAW